MPVRVDSGYEHRGYTYTFWLSVQALPRDVPVSLSSRLHRDDKSSFFKAVVGIQKLKKIYFHIIYLF